MRLKALFLSGVLDGAEVIAGVRTEPTDDSEVRDPADTIASGCFVSQLLEGTTALVEAPRSLDVDLRNGCPKETARGLRAKEDFWLDDEGELVILRLSALEKLHFLEGVLRGADSGAELA